MQTGSDVRISDLAVLRYPELVRIGDRCAIDEFTVVSVALEMGSFIHIAAHCTACGGQESRLIMEDFSGIAAGCRLACGSDDFRGGYLMNPMVDPKYCNVTHGTIRICQFATLGTNAIVLPNVTVGEGATIAAGSLVARDVKPWTICMGVPARAMGIRPRAEVEERARQFLKEYGRGERG